MKSENPETFYPTSKKKWREWLQKNHDKKPSIWLMCYKKDSGKPSLSWSEAVDEAPCFGWIDSTRRTVDEERFIQFFTKRKPTSNWSKINKDKVTKLIEEGLMTQAGQDCIDIAKKNGRCDLMDKVEELEIPKDLEKQFKAHPGSKVYFMGLSKSVKKMMLHWITMAKRDETRERRIKEIVEYAGRKERPKQFM